MKTKWTTKEVNDWYNSLPWLRGSNFLPSNVVNRLDMYQSYNVEKHLEVAEKELELAEQLGFNTVRLWVDFDCYFLEGNNYLEILEKYISLADKHNQLVMLVLTHEEDLPYGEKFVCDKKLGEQEKLYTHFNRNYKEYHSHFLERKHYFEYEETKPLFIELINKIVKKYASDKRIVVWNIYNEPGITIGERSIPIIKEIVKIVRSYDPIQPLCCDIWRNLNNEGETFQSEEEKVGLELTDLISFHCYGKYESFKRRLNILKKFNRPILVTEWLHRINHNSVEDIFPLMAEENAGCYCWGFVNGDTFTDEPWDDFWNQYEQDPNVDYDFTKWQHNLFRRNLKPYNPHEIELIKEVINKKSK